jgi:hypothetical protein
MSSNSSFKLVYHNGKYLKVAVSGGGVSVTKDKEPITPQSLTSIGDKLSIVENCIYFCTGYIELDVSGCKIITDPNAVKVFEDRHAIIRVNESIDAQGMKYDYVFSGKRYSMQKVSTPEAYRFIVYANGEKNDTFTKGWTKVETNVESGYSVYKKDGLYRKAGGNPFIDTLIGSSEFEKMTKRESGLSAFNVTTPNVFSAHMAPVPFANYEPGGSYETFGSSFQAGRSESPSFKTSSIPSMPFQSGYTPSPDTGDNPVDEIYEMRKLMDALGAKMSALENKYLKAMKK